MLFLLLIYGLKGVDATATVAASTVIPTTVIPPAVVPTPVIPEQTPIPTVTPRATLEVMNRLQSNGISYSLSALSIFCITVIGTVVSLYLVFYVVPFLREDLAPLL